MKPLQLCLLCAATLMFGSRVRAADIAWTNIAGGNWNVAANWSPNQIPGAADNAYITNSGTYTVTLNVAATVVSLTLGGASGTQTFTNFTQTLTLNGASTVRANGRLGLSGGALTGTGDLTINSAFNWTGGTISGSGSVTANGGLTISGASGKSLTGRTLVNVGAATWSAGGITLSGSAVLSNAASGTFDCAFDSTIANSFGAGPVIANAGLFRKTAGAGATTINTGNAFNNTGTVEVQNGTLILAGGGTNTGNFTLANGTTLNLSGGTHDLTGGNISGTGTIIVSGGTANFGGTLGLTSILTLSGGTANFNGSGAITPPQLNISGGILGGSNNVTVSGAMNWTGGTVSGANNIFANGGLTISGASKSLTGRTLVNAGVATWSASGITLSGSAVLSNAASGTFDCTFDGAIANAFGAGPVIANAGLFRKTAGTGATIINSLNAFNNTGTVEVQIGTFTLAGGGTHTGNFTIASGATNNLGGGTHNLTNITISGAGTFAVGSGTANFGGTLGGSGTLDISGGTANFGVSAPITLAQLIISGGGTLGGSSSFTVSGALSWIGGTITGSGSVTASGGLTISNSSGKSLTGRTLVNAGVATWSDGAIILSGSAVLSNATSGTFDCAFDGTIANSFGPGPVIANAGLLRKTAGAGATTINAGNAFNNTGTVEVQTGSLSFGGTYVQTAGLTLLNGGSFAISGTPVQIRGGVLAGLGLITGSVSNNAVLSPGTSPGLLIINGAYTQTTNGALHIELAGLSPGTTFDQLIVSNAVTLAGALHVTLTNGFYPAPNFTFSNVVQAAARTGTFATFNFPSNAVGLQVNYGTTNVNIEVINTRPILPAITDKTVDELTLLSFNASATDADSPAQTLSYRLTNSPSGAVINSSGQITWTPTEAQGPNTNGITVVVTDNGTPNLTVTQLFQVVVNEINVAPALTLPPNQNVNEQVPLNLLATAHDTDIPTNAVTFQLVSGPAGLAVSPTGAIAWTPSEAQGSNTYTVTIRVYDTNAAAVNPKSLSTTNSFSIQVNEVNVPPVLTVPASQIITESNLLSVTASATDADLPANPLTFSLVAPPTGMTIHQTSGLITWTPTEAQGSNLYTITVVVTDTNATAVNSKQLSATNTFTVTVNESNLPPVWNAIANTNSNEQVAFSLTVSAFDPDVPANPLRYSLLSPPAGMSINTNSGAISWTPTEAQGPSNYVITVVVTDTNATAINAKQFSATNTFTIVINEVNVAPVLTAPPNAALHAGVTYSNNATATDADIPTNTLTFALVSGPAGLTASSGGRIVWPSTNAAPGAYPVRVRVFDNGAPSLSATQTFTLTLVAPPFVTIRNNGSTNTLTWTAINGTSYRVQFKNNLNLTNWNDLAGDVTASGAIASRPDGPLNANTNRFYRIRVLP